MLFSAQREKMFVPFLEKLGVEFQKIMINHDYTILNKKPQLW